MAQIHSYLTFNGNCGEAMNFYHDCLGGELSMQTIGASPMADKMPPHMKDCILHSMLKSGGIMLLGSDMVPETGLIRGNAVAMAITCSSEEELRRFYEKLSAGGDATHPLEQTFWGGIFGDLIDKYGNHWLLNYEEHPVN